MWFYESSKMIVTVLTLFFLVHGALSKCPCAIQDTEPYGLLKCDPDTINSFPEDITNNSECNIEYDKIWGILLFNQPLSSLGPLAFKEFSNLVQLDIVMCRSLTKVDVDTFIGNSQLKSLRIQDVGLTTLPDSCLDDLFELTKIEVDDEPDATGIRYVSNAWHFCDRLSNSLTIKGKWETQKYLMTSATSREYCDFRRSLPNPPDVGKFCAKSNFKNGTKTLLSCMCTPDEIQSIVCGLEIEHFDVVTFDFPETGRTDVESFYEAESNDFFQDFNYPKYNDTYAQVMRTQKLLGTKLDLSNIVSHTSERTQSVNIHTDTLHVSSEVFEPISFDVSVVSRVASIDFHIPMVFTKDQFFAPMNSYTEFIRSNVITSEPWAFREENIKVNDYVTMRNRKYGRISILDTLPSDELATNFDKLPYLGLECPKGIPKAFYPESCQQFCGFDNTEMIVPLSPSNPIPTTKFDTPLCIPLHIDVTEYTDDRRHWYDTSAVNLIYVAAHTLLSTQSNPRLLKDLSSFNLDYYLNSSVVENDMAFHAAQKFVPILETINKPNSHVVPLYSSNQLKDLSDLLSKELQLYRDDEIALENAIFNTNGRLIDMQTYFDTVETTQELYFEMELETLKEIFTAENESWHWNFEHREEQTALIEEMLGKMMEQMFGMQMQEYEIMKAEAEETVKHYKNALKSYESEAIRYAGKALLEVGVLKEDTITIAQEAKVLIERLEYWLTQVIDYMEYQAVNEIIGWVKILCSFGFFGYEDMKEAYENIDDFWSDGCWMIIDLISSCKSLKDIYDIIKDIEGEDDILQLADLKNNTKDILQLGVQMKGVGSVFTDVKTTINIYMDDLNAKTGHEIDGTPALMVSVDKLCDRGLLFIEEAADFADIMFQFIDKIRAIWTTSADLYNAKKQVIFHMVPTDMKNII